MAISLILYPQKSSLTWMSNHIERKEKFIVKMFQLFKEWKPYRVCPWQKNSKVEHNVNGVKGSIKITFPFLTQLKVGEDIAGRQILNLMNKHDIQTYYLAKVELLTETDTNFHMLTEELSSGKPDFGYPDSYVQSLQKKGSSENNNNNNQPKLG